MMLIELVVELSNYFLLSRLKARQLDRVLISGLISTSPQENVFADATMIRTRSKHLVVDG